MILILMELMSTGAAVGDVVCLHSLLSVVQANGVSAYLVVGTASGVDCVGPYASWYIQDYWSTIIFETFALGF